MLNKDISVGPIFGTGYAFFPASKSEINASENLMQDEPVKDYDYMCAFTDMGGVTPKLFGNLGINITIDRYYGMLIYTRYCNALEAAEIADLILNEKINSISAIIGVDF